MALRSATNAKTLVMSGPTTSNPLDVRGAVAVTSIRHVLKRQIQNLRRAAAIATQ
jgi:hypothetical protein